MPPRISPSDNGSSVAPSVNDNKPSSSSSASRSVNDSSGPNSASDSIPGSIPSVPSAQGSSLHAGASFLGGGASLNAGTSLAGASLEGAAGSFLFESKYEGSKYVGDEEFPYPSPEDALNPDGSPNSPGGRSTEGLHYADEDDMGLADYERELAKKEAEIEEEMRKMEETAKKIARENLKKEMENRSRIAKMSRQKNAMERSETRRLLAAKNEGKGELVHPYQKKSTLQKLWQWLKPKKLKEREEEEKKREDKQILPIREIAKIRDMEVKKIMAIEEIDQWKRAELLAELDIFIDTLYANKIATRSAPTGIFASDFAIDDEYDPEYRLEFGKVKDHYLVPPKPPPYMHWRNHLRIFKTPAGVSHETGKFEQLRGHKLEWRTDNKEDGVFKSPDDEGDLLDQRRIRALHEQEAFRISQLWSNTLRSGKPTAFIGITDDSRPLTLALTDEEGFSGSRKFGEGFGGVLLSGPSGGEEEGAGGAVSSGVEGSPGAGSSGVEGSPPNSREREGGGSGAPNSREGGGPGGLKAATAASKLLRGRGKGKKKGERWISSMGESRVLAISVGAVEEVPQCLPGAVPTPTDEGMLAIEGGEEVLAIEGGDVQGQGGQAGSTAGDQQFQDQGPRKSRAELLLEEEISKEVLLGDLLPSGFLDPNSIRPEDAGPDMSKTTWIQTTRRSPTGTGISPLAPKIPPPTMSPAASAPKASPKASPPGTKTSSFLPNQTMNQTMRTVAGTTGMKTTTRTTAGGGSGSDSRADPNNLTLATFPGANKTAVSFDLNAESSNEFASTEFGGGFGGGFGQNLSSSQLDNTGFLEFDPDASRYGRTASSFYDEVIEATSSLGSKWTAHRSKKLGHRYWINQTTGESRYDDCTFPAHSDVWFEDAYAPPEFQTGMYGGLPEEFALKTREDTESKSLFAKELKEGMDKLI